MDYHPDFTNARVRARITKALEWVEQYVDNKPNWLSTRAIDTAFGQGQLDLSKWLRSKLLITTDAHWNHLTGKCKTYTRNYDGWRELRDIMDGKRSITHKIAYKQAEELAKGQFEYTEKSNRWFNPLQNLPKRVKRTTFKSAGFNYNYDIVSAAPRLLTQYSRRCGLQTPTPLLDAYIQDTQSFRSKLAQDLGLTETEVKFIINAILHGAPITHRHNSSILEFLGNRHLLIDQLQSNSDIIQLKQEISDLWKAIKLDRKITERMTSKIKSSIYRELEQEVMKSIERYLKRTNNQYFKEHDGWMSKMIIDEIELRTYVKKSSGYSIEISCEIFE